MSLKNIFTPAVCMLIAHSFLTAMGNKIPIPEPIIEIASSGAIAAQELLALAHNNSSEKVGSSSEQSPQNKLRLQKVKRKIRKTRPESKYITILKFRRENN